MKLTPYQPAFCNEWLQTHDLIKLHNEPVGYHTQLLWEYRNSLDMEELAQVAQMAQQKIENLRLESAKNEELTQTIVERSETDWEYMDITKLNKSEQNLFVENVIEIDKAYSFESAKKNQLKVYMLKRSEKYYTCIFSNIYTNL